MAWLVGHRETKDAANRDATPIVTAPVVDSTDERSSRTSGLEERKAGVARELKFERCSKAVIATRAHGPEAVARDLLR